MATKETTRARKQAEIFYWLFLVLWFVWWFTFRWYWPNAAIWRHTYQLPQASPGVLTSDFGTWSFYREGFYVFALLAPWTGALMVWARQIAWSRVHWISLIVLLVWFIIVLIFDSIDLGRANLPPTDPSFNPGNLANDLRYCCAYGGQPGTAFLCSINAAQCMPPVGINDLTLNGSFVFRYAMGVLCIAFLLFDLLYTLLVYEPRLKMWAGDTRTPTKEKPVASRYYQLRERQ